MRTTEQAAAQAEQAIRDYEVAADRWVQAAQQEMAMEAGRPAVKREAIARIMAGTNALTNKPHSASSAEAVVEMDQDYAAYLRRQREVVAEKNGHYTDMTAAKLRAELNIALVRHAGAESEVSA